MDEIKDLSVGDVMTRGVICVDVGDTVKNAAEVMKKNDISSVIVVEKGDGVGIVTERDIISKIVAEGKSPETSKIADVMTSPIITINPGADVDDAARIMRDKNIRRILVKDKGKIVGVISEFDIVRVEPALHLLIREHAKWSISEATAASEGKVTGICETCENYSESLVNVDGRLLCDECSGVSE
ncbi:MAG: CBS domain-containing protein [Candidatus Altiarchaeota archaeon]